MSNAPEPSTARVVPMSGSEGQAPVAAAAGPPSNTSSEFLNDLIANLWPNINIAVSKMIKDIVDPMFATMLPGPLASLHFVKLDLGDKPLQITRISVQRTETQGIMLDMDVNWDGDCDIELDGKLIPKVGVESLKLNGRLSVLLNPITSVLPLIGAAQIAFINPPTLELNFTNAANIADCVVIGKYIRGIILDIIGSMAVLPNRYMIKLDTANDYFKTYQPHQGVLRVTVGKATGISGPKKKGLKKLLDKVIKDVPDCYCKVTVGAEPVWKTSTKDNSREPEWNETHDFLVMDHDQCIYIDVMDSDVGADDDMGVAMTTISQLIMSGGQQELGLVHNGEPLPAKLHITSKFFDFVPDTASFTAQETLVDGRICGLATVLIAGARNIHGKKEDLAPSVKVTWGAKTFQTGITANAPGVDVFNPSYDTAFRMPITPDLLKSPAPFKLTLMNKKAETSSIEVPFAEAQGAPNGVLEKEFDVGSGTTIRACITIRGLQL